MPGAEARPCLSGRVGPATVTTADEVGTALTLERARSSSRWRRRSTLHGPVVRRHRQWRQTASTSSSRATVNNRAGAGRRAGHGARRRHRRARAPGSAGTPTPRPRRARPGKCATAQHRNVRRTHSLQFVGEPASGLCDMSEQFGRYVEGCGGRAPSAGSDRITDRSRIGRAGTRTPLPARRITSPAGWPSRTHTYFYVLPAPPRACDNRCGGLGSQRTADVSPFDGDRAKTTAAVHGAVTAFGLLGDQPQ